VNGKICLGYLISAVQQSVSIVTPLIHLLPFFCKIHAQFVTFRVITCRHVLLHELFYYLRQLNKLYHSDKIWDHHILVLRDWIQDKALITLGALTCHVSSLWTKEAKQKAQILSCREMQKLEKQS
jgi:hypothetical protein